MKRFFKTLSLVLGIVLVYKLTLIGAMQAMIPKTLSYNYLGSYRQNQRSIIIAGSSNMEFNFDYELIGKTYPAYNVVGSNFSEPSGFLVNLFKIKKLAKKGDVIVLNVPHSHYDKDKFLPHNTKLYAKLSTEFESYEMKKDPLVFLRYLVGYSLFDKSLYEFASHRIKEGVTDSVAQAFDLHPEKRYPESYFSCHVPYKKESHTIIATTFNRSHLEKIQQVVKDWFPDNIVLFRFPEINAGNYMINPSRIAYMEKHFTFVNSFKNSFYNDTLMYDQWYHLNNCGKQLNTAKFIEEIKPYLSNKN